MKIATFCIVYLLLPCCVLQRIFPLKLQSEEDINNETCTSQRENNSTLVKIRKLLQDQISPILQSSCGGTGWTGVAFLNMTEPSAACPSELTLLSSPVRGCTRRSFSTATCDSVIFSLHGQNYSRVCGKILAYQKGGTNAFYSSYFSSRNNIESQYVSGVSLTYGRPGSRRHIWTFAASRYEQDPNYYYLYNCRCTNRLYSSYTLPSFVGTDYFCDTGNSGPGYDYRKYYSSDPLWDGIGCGIYSSCCSFNSPPWFVKDLSQATADDIEMRVCNRYGSSENIVIFFIDLYVK